MHNHLYSYLVNKKILYLKQFGFQKGHSTEHAITQLADRIHESFENDNYTLELFIDLSKASDTIDHVILLKKLENYGIKDTNLVWFRSYLANRKQYIRITNDGKSNLRNTAYGIPQGSILGPLLFLVYDNDLLSSFKILNPIMFTDDTNLFYEYKNITKLFVTVNEELMNIYDWFMANKLSLAVGKTKYSLFHKPSRVDDLPLKLPKLSINNQEIKRASYTKFLGVVLDENLSWKENLKHTENKIAKSIGLMYKAKPFLDKDSLLSLCFSYIHSYINYTNLAWVSTHKTNNTAFKIPSHLYPARFSNLNYSKPKTRLRKRRFWISIRGPATLKKFVTNTEKELEYSSLFKSKVKTKLLEFENEVTLF